MRRKLVILFWTLVAGNCVAAQGDARPLALEDYYRLVAIQSPAMSPDGRWVASIKSTLAEAENRCQNELWLVPSDRSTPIVRSLAECHEPKLEPGRATACLFWPTLGCAGLG